LYYLLFRFLTHYWSTRQWLYWSVPTGSRRV